MAMRNPMLCNKKGIYEGREAFAGTDCARKECVSGVFVSPPGRATAFPPRNAAKTGIPESQA